MTRKSEEQFELILQYMSVDREYKMQEFLELFEVGERRVQKILRDLVDMRKIEIIGSNRDRRCKRIDD